MIIFLDSSAIVKFFLEEMGSTEVEQCYQVTSGNPNIQFSTAAVTYAEVMATLARCHRNHRLPEEEFRQAIADFKEQWRWYFIPEVGNSLIENGGNLSLNHILKGCDAFQLASAIESEADLFISSDRELLTAAQEVGLEVWNPERDVMPKITG